MRSSKPACPNSFELRQGYHMRRNLDQYQRNQDWEDGSSAHANGLAKRTVGRIIGRMLTWCLAWLALMRNDVLEDRRCVGCLRLAMNMGLRDVRDPEKGAQQQPRQHPTPQSRTALRRNIA